MSPRPRFAGHALFLFFMLAATLTPTPSAHAAEEPMRLTRLSGNFDPYQFLCTALVFNDQMWILGGGVNPSQNGVWRSADGIHWTQAAAAAAWPSRDSHTSVVFNGKMWVLGGSHGGAFSNDVWCSADGTSWTLVTGAAPWPPRFGHSSVVHDGKIWVMGGAGSLKTLNDVWYSSDGKNWTQATAAAPWYPRRDHGSVVFNNKIWVIGGAPSGGDATIHDAWSSSDGVVWKENTWLPHQGPQSSRSAVAVYMGRIWVMAGYRGGITGSSTNEVWASADGANWTLQTIDSTFPTSEGLVALNYLNKLWILGYPDILVLEPPINAVRAPWRAYH